MLFRAHLARPKKPSLILRCAWRLGFRPGRLVTEILEWAEVLLIAGGLAFLIMTFVTVRMHVPTGSMIPTIDPRDSFFVDRITYLFRDPSPGQIIVFWHTELVYVREVVSGSPAARAGLKPGERVLALNSREVFSTAAIDRELATWSDGVALVLKTDAGLAYDIGRKSADVGSLKDLGVITREVRKRYVKRLVAVEGQTVQIRNGRLVVDGEEVRDIRFDRFYEAGDPRHRFGTEPTLVPAGCYFVLGDNSRDSFDSRYWGFVDKRDFIGVPYVRVWPLSRFGGIH